MLLHPDLALTLAHDRHRELIAEADRRRLVALARRRRADRQPSTAAQGRPAAARQPQSAPLAENPA